MSRFTFIFGALATMTAGAYAQVPTPSTEACASPDSIIIRGNSRVTESQIRSDAALPVGGGVPLNYRAEQRALKALYATSQFDDVRVSCEPAASGKANLVIAVIERPVLGDVTVTGANAVSPRTVKEKVDILIGRPIDPAQVARIIQRIDSVYEADGYYLARVRAETTVVNGKTKLNFAVDEGRRLAISGIEIRGNSSLRAGTIVKAMKTKPEGFWWFRRGEFDDDKFREDLGDRIPKLYAHQGFVDFQVTRDTLIVDRARGKALIRLDVTEGPRYRIGSFDVAGNRRFSTDEITRFYPFTLTAPTITARLGGVLRRAAPHGQRYFDQAQWDAATQSVRTAYSNEGYIYASVRPVVERVTGPDSIPTVNLRWEIEEQKPATINRVEIVGNDYTAESCIRNQVIILPGDVFNQDRLIRSWQNLGNLGFFEAPVAPPETRQANDQGDVDIVFKVKEKRTGNINFGASVGQGTGLGGFLGLDQPNLFGQCKRVSGNFQFGQYINDYSVSFTDPAIKQSRISGTLTGYHTRSRFIVADLGRSVRTGGSLQFGFPIPRARFSSIFLSYGGEAVTYSGGLFQRDTSAQSCNDCFRSTFGVTAQRETRIGLPFATGGSFQNFTAQFNGGPLGGTANFQRYTTELRTYAPLGEIGGTKPGSQPSTFVLGLTARAGSVFGNVGPFFVSQAFALGGTQFGEQLRGYDEFSITPQGYISGTSTQSARRASFGNAYFTTTAELGLRVNQMVYTNVFFDAGNIWNRPREFDPTRLFRGAGVGVSLVTPLGPLGLDWGYGFDRVDAQGRPAPKWVLHFKFGQLF